MHAWLENQIGQSAANIITSFVVLIIVIAAIAVIISLLRKFNGGTFVVGGKSRTPRLSVRDAAAVDRTRRLVLVRRDNVEHLLMIGGPTDLVIETNIEVKDATKQESFISPITNAAKETVSAPAYREPLINEPLAPQKDVALSQTPRATMEQREPTTAPLRNNLNVAPLRSDPLVASTPETFNRVSPELNVSVPDKNIGLNRSPLASPHGLREPRMTDFSASSTDRMTPQQSATPALDPHITPPIKDEMPSSEIEGRREPSLKVPAKSADPTDNLDDDFDHMFENELNDAIKNEKI